MPQPKPLKDIYAITKDAKKDLKSTIKPLMDHAVRGNKQFIEEISKINWESLCSKDVFVVILMMLSYGLKTQPKIFEDYIKKENMKSSASIFRFMRDYDGLRVKNCLNTGSFMGIFNTVLFADTDSKIREKTFNNLQKRVNKIKPKDFSDEERTEVDALMDSIIQGKEIKPEIVAD